MVHLRWDVWILGGMVEDRPVGMLGFFVDVEDKRWFASAFWQP
jgi:hypothetical protein